MASQEWRDINESVRGEWVESTTAQERVENTLLNTRTPRSAPVIAEEAVVSAPTARKRLNRLAELNIASVKQTENGKRYWRNDMYDLTRRIHELHDEFSVADLEDSVVELEEEFEEMSEELGVDNEIYFELEQDITAEMGSIDDEEESMAERLSLYQTVRRNYITAVATLWLKYAVRDR